MGHSDLNRKKTYKTLGLRFVNETGHKDSAGKITDFSLAFFFDFLIGVVTSSHPRNNMGIVGMFVLDVAFILASWFLLAMGLSLLKSEMGSVCSDSDEEVP